MFFGIGKKEEAEEKKETCDAEIDDLSEDSDDEDEELAQKRAKLLKTQTDLESQIEEYERESEALAEEIAGLKKELKSTEKKLAEYKALQGDISSQKERLRSELKNCKNKQKNLVEDSLICSAFLTYLGPFAESERKLLQRNWKYCLEEIGLAFTTDKEAVELLHMRGDRNYRKEDQAVLMKSQIDQNLENLAIINWGKRYPLITELEESGVRFIELIDEETQSCPRIKISDEEFMKNLQISLEFNQLVFVNGMEQSENTKLVGFLNQNNRQNG